MILPFIAGSPLTLLLQLTQILPRWAASFSPNPSSPVHKEKQSSLSLSELLLLYFWGCKQTWVIISNNWERENKRTHFFPTEKFLAHLLTHLFLINAFIHVKGMSCLITSSEGHLAGVHQHHTGRWFILEYTVYLQSNSNSKTALPGPKPNCFGNKCKREHC